MLLALTKIKNLFTFINLYFILKKISFIKKDIKEKTILLIRLDAIGDYILLRNFIRALKTNKKYNAYKITLCGNIIWKELAETFDSDIIDEFIWLDRKKYKSSLIYKYNFLKDIKLHGFETAVDLTYSREILFGDTIIKASNANERIGSEGSLDSYVTWKRKLFSDNNYTRLIPASRDNLFEFYRNKEFFKNAFGSSENIETTYIDTTSSSYNPGISGKFVILFPGAGDEKRRWGISNYSEVAELLTKKYNLNVVICGSPADKSMADSITRSAGEKVLDFTGKTTLSELAKLISLAEILVSNDTGAVHFAAAVKTPFVCISNGNHLGRFHPYPHDIFDKGYYIYPDEISENMNNPEYLEKFRFGSDLDINSIPVERVKEAIKKVL